MVASLARQAVIIKSGNDTSILTGNYELAYALGFLANQLGISLSESDVDIQDLHGKMVEELKNRTLEEEKDKASVPDGQVIQSRRGMGCTDAGTASRGAYGKISLGFVSCGGVLL